MLAYEIAEKCGYKCVGKNRLVCSIKYAEYADKDSIAIAYSSKMIQNTKAESVLAQPTFVPTDKTLIFVDEPIELASVHIAQILIDGGVIKKFELPDYKSVSGYYIGRNVFVGRDTQISPNVYIGNDVCIGNHCIIEPGVIIHSGSVIMDHVYISANSSIGAKSFYHYFDTHLREFEGVGRTIIHDYVKIGSHTNIQRGTFSDTVIEKGSQIGNLVEIGHDVKIGKECKIVSQTGIAGNAVLGNFVLVYGQVGIANGVRVGDGTVIMGKSAVTKSVGSYKKISGMYAREHTEELKTLAKIRKL